jgi:hypothetical protein
LERYGDNHNPIDCWAGGVVLPPSWYLGQNNHI